MLEETRGEKIKKDNCIGRDGIGLESRGKSCKKITWIRSVGTELNKGGIFKKRFRKYHIGLERIGLKRIGNIVIGKYLIG